MKKLLGILLFILALFFAYAAVFALAMVLSEMQSGVSWEAQEIGTHIGQWLITALIGFIAFWLFKKGVRLLK
ncbi:MAG: hypothetical protein K0S26_1000 [Bacteroidota bacterium]|jgi:hypothetical protein|nr:hypothetical protein [Bacteroidota bacterium]